MSGAEARPALARCVSVDASTFAAEYWDTAPLLTRANDLPAGYTDLLSAPDVDSLLAERGLRSPFFRLVRDGTSVSGGTRRAVTGSRTVDDLADPEAIRQRYAEGATLVLQSLHRIWPPLVDFCRQLAADLGHPTQCNAYVTPGGDAKGFAFHHDTHDVFVLQVTGRKRWQVHRPVIELPTSRQRRSGADLVEPGQPPLIDTELHAGDALYLPRGFVHAAQTTDSRSIHLTVGVQAITWYDVLRDVTGLAADQLEFRHALPVSPLDALHADPALAAGVLQQAAAWLADLPSDQVHALLEQRLGRAIAAEPLQVLEQSEAVSHCSPTTRTRPRRGLRWQLSGDSDRIVLRLPDRTLELPAYAEPALRRALGISVTPAELSGGAFDEAGAVVLVRRLLREGIVIPFGD